MNKWKTEQVGYTDSGSSGTDGTDGGDSGSTGW